MSRTVILSWGYFNNFKSQHLLLKYWFFCYVLTHCVGYTYKARINQFIQENKGFYAIVNFMADHIAFQKNIYCNNC